LRTQDMRPASPQVDAVEPPGHRRNSDIGLSRRALRTSHRTYIQKCKFVRRSNPEADHHRSIRSSVLARAFFAPMPVSIGGCSTPPRLPRNRPFLWAYPLA
jgi:hypothetical protein